MLKLSTVFLLSTRCNTCRQFAGFKGLNPILIIRPPSPNLIIPIQSLQSFLQGWIRHGMIGGSCDH